MEIKEVRSAGLLFITAAVWGFAFVAQRAGMEHVGPFTFNAVRFALGSLTLAPFCIFGRQAGAPDAVSGRRTIGLPAAAAMAGTVLFLGAILQQVGLVYTTAGKAGFITGLYVVLVPIIGIACGHRVGIGGWAGAILAAIGLYLLSVRQGIDLAPGDGPVFAGAFFWALHVLLIGRWSRHVDPVRLAMCQFAVVAALSAAGAVLLEAPAVDGIVAAAVPILYGGVMSVGVGFTLQVVAQRHSAPVATAVIMSLEAVFAALGGWLILDEYLSGRGVAGCMLMLAGVLVSQLYRRGETVAQA